jgi:hypothetical protein
MQAGLFLFFLGGVCLATRSWHYALLCRLADELGVQKPVENRKLLVTFYSALMGFGAGCIIVALISPT